MSVHRVRGGHADGRRRGFAPRRARWRGGFALLLAALGVCAPVWAANLQVSPLLIEFAAGQEATGVKLGNLDPESALTVQARVFRWQQVDGQDVYLPTDDITLSPPVAKIEPGRENLIRLVHTSAAPVEGEVSYRLILDELPAPEAETPAFSGVSMVIRQLLPVFVSGKQVRPAKPEWQVARAGPDDEGQARSGYEVSIHNAGDRHVRLSELKLMDAGGNVIAQNPGLAGYALGQSTMVFFVPDVEGAHAQEAVSLWVRTESGELDTGLLPVSPPGA